MRSTGFAVVASRNDIVPYALSNHPAAGEINSKSLVDLSAANSVEQGAPLARRKGRWARTTPQDSDGFRSFLWQTNIIAGHLYGVNNLPYCELTRSLLLGLS